MVIVPFAEHPTFHPDSLSNSEPEKVKNNTRYWQAAAFGEHTPLLEGLPAGKAYILTGYPKAFKKIGQGGKTEVVHNGFVVVGREAYPGLSKQRRGQ
jgi:hypothetical protein